MYKYKINNQSSEDKVQLTSHSKNHDATSKKVTCPFCNDLFAKCGIKSHMLHCKQNPSRIVSKNEQYKLEAAKWFFDPQECQHCGKECKNKNSLINHERVCKKNPERQTTIMENIEWQEEMRSRIDRSKVWNKGLTAETDVRVRRGADKCKEYYNYHDGSFKGKHHSDTTKQKIRDYAVEHDHYKHFGRHKHITYKDTSFQSSYEVLTAMELDKNSIRWETPCRLPYVDINGKNHYYIADFYLPDYDIYLDPKNDFLIECVNPHFGYKDIDKIRWVMEQNNVKIIVLDKDHLTWDSIKQEIDKLCRVTPRGEVTAC